MPSACRSSAAAQRAAEYVDAMRTLWRDDVASFHGEFVDFDQMRVNPKPRDRRIPVVLGGNSDAALRRVAAWGDGWYGFNLADVEEAAGCASLLRSLCRAAGRDPAIFGWRWHCAIRCPTICAAGRRRHRRTGAGRQSPGRPHQGRGMGR